MILRRAMGEFGFQVSEAGSGAEALEKLDSEPEPPALLLVDWNMPEMNGLEFVKQLRTEGQFNAIPVMMVTTETESDQMLAALEAGANEYVIKPFTKETIEDKLRILGLLE